jgi:hypothetical protein
VALPTFLIGPAFAVGGWVRDWHQNRRKVRLTVHQAREVLDAPNGSVSFGRDVYCITVTNASRDRDIVVTHVWLDTSPQIHIPDPELPVRLKYSAQWETHVAVATVPEDATRVGWLARCQITPDDRVIKSRPRERVPPFGRVPRANRDP